MCLIVVKPAGVIMPKEEDMSEWFATHPDGMGVSFQHRGKVKIIKGAMTEPEMFKLVDRMGVILGKKNPKNTDIVFHFRQATEGNVSPKNCHPFPITQDERLHALLESSSENAIAHNGIISEFSSWSLATKTFGQTQKTDTQQFIEQILAPLGDKLFDENVLRLVTMAANSKFALMLPNKVKLLGTFVEESGYHYSNNGYKWESYYDYGSYGSGWENYEPSAYYRPPRRAWAYKTNPEIELDDILPGQGIVCESCDTPAPIIYSIMGGEFVVCRECFVLTEGRQPYEEERYV